MSTTLGVGVDVASVDRFRAVISRRPGVVTRLFTPGEREWAERHRDPAERLAARFAAKEAAMKALGVGLGAFPFAAVEVTNDTSGRPSLKLTGAAAALADARGVSDWKVSMSHDAGVAVAVVLALGADR